MPGALVMLSGCPWALGCAGDSAEAQHYESLDTTTGGSSTWCVVCQEPTTSLFLGNSAIVLMLRFGKHCSNQREKLLYTNLLDPTLRTIYFPVTGPFAGPED
jgi:hypothetical protein